MIGLRRRGKGAGRQTEAAARIEADLSGAVISGQVAIGEHIVQIHADHGAIVNYSAPEQQPVPRLRSPPPRRMPRDFPTLLGRDDALAAARQGLASGGPVEVHGLDGIGKTSLLRHLAHRTDPDAGQGLLYVSCRRLPTEDLFQFLFEGFYECDRVLVPSPAQLSEYMRRPRALVLLDDLEAEREDLESVLSLAPSCAFVWAAEERRLWGEGRSLGLAGLDPRAALALFEHELGGPLPGEYREQAEDFCRAVGHPLRILQAAALVARGELTPAALSQSARSDRPIAASLGESVGEHERLVLGPLAALPDAELDAGLAATASEEPKAPEILASLEERGVVHSHSPSYSLRKGAIDALDGELRGGDSLRLRRTLSALARWVEARSDPREVAGASGAILAALEAGMRAGLAGDVLRLARGSDAGLMASGRWGAWREALGHGLSAARQLQDPGAEAWALHELGSRALPRGENEVAESALSDALRLREGLGDADGAAVTRHNLGLLGGGPPPAPPEPPGGPPRWLLPGGLAAIAAVGLAAAVLALAGRDDETTQPAEPAPAVERNSAGDEPAAEDENGPASDGEPAPGDAEAAVLEPSAVSFEGVYVGDEASATVTATNPGPVSIVLGQVRLSSGEEFVIGNEECSGRTLEPDESCQVEIVFRPGAVRKLLRPGAVRKYSGELTVADTGTGEPASIELSGSAVRPPGEYSPPREEYQAPAPPETTTPPPSPSDPY